MVPTEIASAFGQFRISVFQYLGFQLGDPLLSLTSWAWLILLGYVLALLFIHRPRKRPFCRFSSFSNQCLSFGAYAFLFEVGVDQWGKSTLFHWRLSR